MTEPEPVSHVADASLGDPADAPSGDAVVAGAVPPDAAPPPGLCRYCRAPLDEAGDCTKCEDGRCPFCKERWWIASCAHVLAIWDDGLDWYPPDYFEREYPEIPEHLSAGDYTEEELVAALGDLRPVLERCGDDFTELTDSFTLWKALLPSLSTPISRIDTCVDGWCTSSYRITYVTAEPDVAEVEITELLRRLAAGVRQLAPTLSHGV